MGDGKTRTERDGMGEMPVPEEAYFGASTARAVRNFPVSGWKMPSRFVRALGRIKEAAARTNGELGLLDDDVARAIAAAADEVAEGRWDGEFVVDVFQTGSGTSTNMNANEVIANRAAEILGHPRGSRELVHPNDHVNLGQSSNDVIPTALHLAGSSALRELLEPAVRELRRELERKSTETRDVVKSGRTHLQDATPVRLGQVFAGHAGQMERAEHRLARAREELAEVALGGTAVGTGINTHPEFASRVCARLSEREGVAIRETGNHFQAQATLDAVVAASGQVRTVAVSLRKIADDIRWMASGPRCGLGEIALPEVQPGSSIMPGKVNPVLAESLLQACAHVLAADAAIVTCGQGGIFELNTMLPLTAYHFVQAIEILGSATSNFAGGCVRGIVATARAGEAIERSLALATALVPHVGYDAAAAIAKEAAETGRTIREVALERTGIDEGRLAEILDPGRMC